MKSNPLKVWAFAVVSLKMAGVQNDVKNWSQPKRMNNQPASLKVHVFAYYYLISIYHLRLQLKQCAWFADWPECPCKKSEA